MSGCFFFRNTVYILSSLCCNHVGQFQKMVWAAFIHRWWFGVVVSALASINEVNLQWAQLVVIWVTVSGFNSRCQTFISVCNQPATQGQLSLPSSPSPPPGVGKWVPTLAGTAKAGMVHSVSVWTRGVQVKLWDPLRIHAVPEHLRGVIMTRHYTNPRLPYLTLHLRWLYTASQRYVSTTTSPSSNILSIAIAHFFQVHKCNEYMIWKTTLHS